MGKIEEGTEEWVGQLQSRAVRHVRAFDQLNQALQCLMKLHEGWELLDEVVKSALFTSAVVHYARPFGVNKAERGSQSYGIGELKRAAGFDRELHDHLLDLRNKVVAHQDGTLLRARAGHLMLRLREHEVEIPVQTLAVAMAVQGFGTKEILTRCLNHLKVCVETVWESVQQALGDMNAAAHKYPDVQPETMKKFELWSEKSIPGTGAKVAAPSALDSDFVNLQTPNFGVPADSYAWRRTAVTFTPQAKYEWTGPDGPATLEVSTSLPLPSRA
jgi:hypothetical protein